MSRSTPLLENRYFENQTERLDIWARIFIDSSWLAKKLSLGLVPALVGWVFNSSDRPRPRQQSL
jgi:hypothetical protein